MWEEVQPFEDVIQTLEGQTFDFYGVNDQSFALDNGVYTAVEDPDDGYRSYLGGVAEESCVTTFLFSRERLARVRLERYEHMDEAKSQRYGYTESFEGFRLVDVDTGHVWLEFGTDFSDDYYPCFVFRYAIPGTQHPEDHF